MASDTSEADIDSRVGHGGDNKKTMPEVDCSAANKEMYPYVADEVEKFFHIAAVFISSMLDWTGQSRWEFAMVDLREKSALGSGWAKGNL